MERRHFTAKHYESGEGMMTAVWGPSLWHSLHSISFNYPVHPTRGDKKNYRDFMYSLQNVLPCGKCRENLKIYYRHNPITNACMSSRRSFSLYVYKLHEAVNKLLGKKSGLTYCEVRDLYEHFRARCKKTKKNQKFFSKKEVKGKGCSEPLYGLKSKCVLSIVPAGKRCKSMKIDSHCLKKTRRRR